MDAPKESNLHLYLKECKNRNVTDIVRISEPSYSAKDVQASGVNLHEMFYPDGSSPPKDLIDRWVSLVSATFGDGKQDPLPCIAIHCVAGLGRAPVLVAIAMIEYGAENMEAVSFIRKRRRGAINTVQLNYLENYRRTRRGKGKCVIS